MRTLIVCNSIAQHEVGDSAERMRPASTRVNRYNPSQPDPAHAYPSIEIVVKFVGRKRMFFYCIVCWILLLSAAAIALC